MRKPVFMGSLWLRARFDVEYMGLPLPTAPASLAGELLMEADLDYIGATRRDRIIAEQVRREHQKRLEWVARWLDRFGWTFDLLPDYLSEQIPLPGQSRRRGPARAGGRLHPGPRRHRHPRPVDRGPQGRDGIRVRRAAGSEEAPAGAARPGRQPPHALAPRASRSKRPLVRPVRSSLLSVLRPGIAHGGSSLICAGIAGWPGAGSRSCWARERATRGPS